MRLNQLSIEIAGSRVSLRDLAKAKMFLNVVAKRVAVLGRESVVGVPITGAPKWSFRPFECTLAEFTAIVQCEPQWEHLAQRVRIRLEGTQANEYVEIDIPVELTIYQSERKAQS
jgi:hypothetical protein